MCLKLGCRLGGWACKPAIVCKRQHPHRTFHGAPLVFLMCAVCSAPVSGPFRVWYFFVSGFVRESTNPTNTKWGYLHFFSSWGFWRARDRRSWLQPCQQRHSCYPVRHPAEEYRGRLLKSEPSTAAWLYMRAGQAGLRRDGP